MSEKQVRACANCGSADLNPFGETSSITSLYRPLGKYECRECGHVGVPILFDSDEERVRFRKSRKER